MRSRLETEIWESPFRVRGQSHGIGETNRNEEESKVWVKENVRKVGKEALKVEKKRHKQRRNDESVELKKPEEEVLQQEVKEQ